MADSLHGGPSAPQAGMDAGAGGCACFLGCPFRQEPSKTGANSWGINAVQISIHQDIMLYQSAPVRDFINEHFKGALLPAF